MVAAQSKQISSNTNKEIHHYAYFSQTLKPTDSNNARRNLSIIGTLMQSEWLLIAVELLLYGSIPWSVNNGNLIQS
jgi:hypothetical protein